jgi:hypothetical protein
MINLYGQDPEWLGKWLLGLCLLIGCGPHAALCIIQSAQGLKVAPTVAYYIGEPISGGTSAMMVYGTLWPFASVLLLIVALLFVPNYAKWQQHQQAAILAAEQNQETVKTVSLSRVLFGSSCVMMVICLSLVRQTLQHEQQEFPIQIPLTALAVCFMLIFFLLDANVKRFLKEKLTAKMQSWPKEFYLCRSSAINPIKIIT